MFSLCTWIYFEWIESKSNWADGISRDGFSDPWHKRHNIRASKCHLPAMMLKLPLKPVIQIASAL